MSATRIADVYNEATAPTVSQLISDSSLKNDLEYEVVLDAFFLYSLLLDYARRQQLSAEPLPPFRLPHGGLQDSRFDAALEERNARYADNGRKSWSHACEMCYKIVERPDGQKGQDSVILILSSSPLTAVFP